MKRYIFGIDGTGPLKDKKYTATFAKSHVNTLTSLPIFDRGFYIRGPGLAGNWTDHCAREIFEECLKYYHPDFDVEIYLTGYSRGGAAAMRVANLLKAENIPVKAMFLFDAVDRSRYNIIPVIPYNVGSCYHVRRSPGARSRLIFGNTGTALEPRPSDFEASGPARYEEKFFMGTHGGVGGVPQEEATFLKFGYIAENGPLVAGRTNIKPDQNIQAARDSWDWMRPRVDRAMRA